MLFPFVVDSQQKQNFPRCSDPQCNLLRHLRDLENKYLINRLKILFTSPMKFFFHIFWLFVLKESLKEIKRNLKEHSIPLTRDRVLFSAYGVARANSDSRSTTTFAIMLKTPPYPRPWVYIFGFFVLFNCLG